MGLQSAGGAVGPSSRADWRLQVGPSPSPLSSMSRSASARARPFGRRRGTALSSRIMPAIGRIAISKLFARRSASLRTSRACDRLCRAASPPRPSLISTSRLTAPSQLAVGIAQRRRIRREWHPCPIRAFGRGLGAAHLPVLLDRHRHRALVVGQRRPVRPEQPPGAAPSGAAQIRAPTPQIGCSPVVEGEAAGGIGEVDRGRQGLEQIAGQDPAIS